MNKFKLVGFFALLISAIIFSGCSFTGSPRPRPGIYATHAFTDYDELGHHNYSSFVGESDGMVYTCRGGAIDIAHLRIGADNTYYLYNKTVKELNKGQTDFKYSLNTDPSVFNVHITYPGNFKSLPKAQQEKIIDEVSLEAAQYFTWYMVTWHETLTWMGLSFMGAPQFHSAFAWEDSYSNLMGTIVGADAIRRGGNFNDAMTAALEAELLKLDPQPAEVGRRSAEIVKGKWYKGGLTGTQMLLRNLDIGTGDGTLTPAIAPGLCTNVKPMLYPVPRLNTAKRYGFNIDLEIKVNGFGGNECLKRVYAGGKRGYVKPATDLPVIMDCIAQQAKAKGYLVIK